MLKPAMPTCTHCLNPATFIDPIGAGQCVACFIATLHAQRAGTELWLMRPYHRGDVRVGTVPVKRLTARLLARVVPLLRQTDVYLQYGKCGTTRAFMSLPYWVIEKDEYYAS